MDAKGKKNEPSKGNEELHTQRKISAHSINDNDIDLGDADGSSNNLGMDNFKRSDDKNKLPSEKGRIEEL